MTFALTCALCLAAADPSLPLEPRDGSSPSLLGLQLRAPGSASSADPGMDLAVRDLPRDLFQHDHGGSPPGAPDHDGHSGMMTTMIVVMVVMMVVVGGVMMSRGWRMSSTTSGASPADRALPVGMPQRFSPSGG